MADPQVVQIWLDKADEDLNFASAALREGNESLLSLMPLCESLDKDG